VGGWSGPREEWRRAAGKAHGGRPRCSLDSDWGAGIAVHRYGQSKNPAAAEGVECLEESPGLEQRDVPELPVQQWPGRVQWELNLPAQVLLL